MENPNDLLLSKEGSRRSLLSENSNDLLLSKEGSRRSLLSENPNDLLLNESRHSRGLFSENSEKLCSEKSCSSMFQENLSERITLLEKIKKDADIKYEKFSEFKQKEIDNLKKKLSLLASCSIQIVRNYLGYKKENEELKEINKESENTTQLFQELRVKLSSTYSNNIKLNKKITKLNSKNNKLQTDLNAIKFKYNLEVPHLKYKCILLEEQLVDQELQYIYERLLDNYSPKEAPVDSVQLDHENSTKYIEYDKYSKILEMYNKMRLLYVKCLEDKRKIENVYINYLQEKQV